MLLTSSKKTKTLKRLLMTWDRNAPNLVITDFMCWFSTCNACLLIALFICFTAICSPTFFVSGLTYTLTFTTCAGTLVNVVIPRPQPDGDLSGGVGKVCILDLSWFKFLLPWYNIFFPSSYHSCFLHDEDDDCCCNYYYYYYKNQGCMVFLC